MCKMSKHDEWYLVLNVSRWVFLRFQCYEEQKYGSNIWKLELSAVSHSIMTMECEWDKILYLFYPITDLLSNTVCVMSIGLLVGAGGIILILLIQ